MKILTFFLLIITSSYTYSDWEHKARLDIETRQFEDDENDETFENQRSVLINYKADKTTDKSFYKVSLTGRFDDQDPKRKHAWVEDSYFQYNLTDNTSFITGVQTFNYSQMEVFNPLDNFNAKIFDISVLNEEKLGEPMIGIESLVSDGVLKLYLLPYPTKPILPGKDSRLNLEKNFNEAVWIGDRGVGSTFLDHFLLSFEKSYDRFDLLLMTSKSFDRSRLIVGTDEYYTFNGTVIPETVDLYTPYFFERYLSGVSAVYNFDSFQVKGGVAYSFFLAQDEIYTVDGLKSPKDNTTAFVGIEKTFSHANGFDSSIIIEHQKMYIDEEDEVNYMLQNDAFIAWRLSFNDVKDKTVTLSYLEDVTNSEVAGFARFSYSQRINNEWKINVDYIDYFIPSSTNSVGLGFFKNKENLALKLMKYF